MKLDAKRFHLDLLSTFRDQPLPMAALVAAGEILGIPENSIRVAIARMLAAGQLERDEQGRYRLGPGAEPMATHVSSWRELEQRTRPWSGAWIGVHSAGSPSHPGGQVLRQRERALRMLGFATLEEGLSVRPDNLVGGVEPLRAELRGLGLESGALVFSLHNLDRVSDARARGLWNVAELCAGYAHSLVDIEASERRLTQMTEPESLAETFRLGSRVITQILLDPLLPEPISPIRQRRALVESAKRYERVARKLWAHFLAPFTAGGRTPQRSGENPSPNDEAARG